MKKFNYILGLTMSATLLLTGCMKEDIDELRAQQAENAARIAALEEWQATVNGNISALHGIVAALENNDYVTNVVKFDTPSPGGYRITFTKSGEATIWNGAKGDKGEDAVAPVIGVAEYPAGSGVYYWTLDSEFIEVSGQKIPMTGKTPKVAIGSNRNWYISTDGSATGTPPGTGWTDTGVNAVGPTGPQGIQGDRGDAIFAANGIDNTNADYVVFTLANGGATITLPKYKAIGISFIQPGIFIPATEKRVAYTGTIAPADVRISGVPKGWSISIDKTTREIVITPPADFTDAGVEFGTATIYLEEGNRIEKMYKLELLNQYVVSNTMNATYFKNGVANGVVFQVKTPTEPGKVVCLNQQNLVGWGDNAVDEQAAGVEGIRDASDGYTGTYNLIRKRKDQADFSTTYGAFNWIYAKNDYNLTGSWYMPSIDELTAIFNIQNTINPGIEALGGTKVFIFYYLSSTEYAINGAFIINMESGRVYSNPNFMSKGYGSDQYVRVIAKF